MICVSFWKPSGKILFLGCNVVQPLIFVIRWKLMQEGKNFQRKVIFVMFYEALVSLDVNLLKIEQWEKTQKCRSTWISLLCLSSVLNSCDLQWLHLWAWSWPLSVRFAADLFRSIRWGCSSLLQCLAERTAVSRPEVASSLGLQDNLQPPPDTVNLYN